MKKIITLLAVFIFSFSVYAQNAYVVTDILNSSEITYGQACYLSAVSQGLAADTDDLNKALDILKEKGQISNSIEGSKPVNIQELSSIYAKMFPNIKGGIFFRITKGSSRYAFRQFKADGLIPSNTDPSKILSGQEALSLFTKANLKYGENQFSDDL